MRHTNWPLCLLCFFLHVASSRLIPPPLHKGNGGVVRSRICTDLVYRSVCSVRTIFGSLTIPVTGLHLRGFRRCIFATPVVVIRDRLLSGDLKPVFWSERHRHIVRTSQLGLMHSCDATNGSQWLNYLIGKAITDFVSSEGKCTHMLFSVFARAVFSRKRRFCDTGQLTGRRLVENPGYSKPEALPIRF